MSIPSPYMGGGRSRGQDIAATLATRVPSRLVLFRGAPSQRMAL